MEEKFKDYLDTFEVRVEAGMNKLFTSSGMLPTGPLPLSDDITDKWNDYIKDYVSDAVKDFVSYPDAAISWAAYLGMAVANHWDRDWNLFKNASYSSYYGSRGWDDMDEHICGDILKLQADESKRLASALQNCSQTVLSFLRHEHIDTQTSLGFYALVRIYTVMFRVGAAIELNRLGYKMMPISQKMFRTS